MNVSLKTISTSPCLVISVRKGSGEKNSPSAERCAAIVLPSSGICLAQGLTFDEGLSCQKLNPIFTHSLPFSWQHLTKHFIDTVKSDLEQSKQSVWLYADTIGSTGRLVSPAFLENILPHLSVCEFTKWKP